MNNPEDSLHPGLDRAFRSPARMQGLARSGAIAAVIKLASAALSFLMFVAIALVTDERQFGLFAATYAGASLVSFFSTVGQQSVVLRFWPQYASMADLPSARSFMARSLSITLVSLVASSAAVILVGLLPGMSTATPEWLPLCLAASLLAFALGWSEVASGALRAKSVLIAGLMPRDITWRALTILAVLGIYLAGLSITAAEATLICGALLVLAVAPQALGLLRDTIAGPRSKLTPEQRKEFRIVTTGLWGVTSLPPALGQVSTLLVAAILGPEIAGGIFVAERTTRLVTVALSGINQALAPEISGEFHRGNKKHVQNIAGLSAVASTIVALGAMLVFAVLGNWVLSVFDPAYATPTMLAVLLTFAAGAAVISACGPVELLLQLTGGQHLLLMILLVVNPAGLALTAVATWLYGPIGAASGIAATVAVWNIIAVYLARRRLGIDPSLLGVLRRARGR